MSRSTQQTYISRADVNHKKLTASQQRHTKKPIPTDKKRRPNRIRSKALREVRKAQNAPRLKIQILPLVNLFRAMVDQVMQSNLLRPATSSTQMQIDAGAKDVWVCLYVELVAHLMQQTQKLSVCMKKQSPTISMLAYAADASPLWRKYMKQIPELREIVYPNEFQ